MHRDKFVDKNVDRNLTLDYDRGVSSNTTTVRISNELHELLKKMAEQSAVSMQDILQEALERYRRERFLEELNQDFARASSYTDELDDIDGTAADGLEDY